MDFSINGDAAVIRTGFSDKQDMLIFMRGMETALKDYNAPVDFRAAGVQRKGHRDLWHMDSVFSLATDEVSPVQIARESIGGNHCFPCAVRVTLPGHGLGLAAVGTTWKDEAGIEWTLMRVENEASLLFLSADPFENDTLSYRKTIEGGLSPRFPAGEAGTFGRFLTEKLPTGLQKAPIDLIRGVRTVSKEFYGTKNGERVRLYGTATELDKVEIIDTSEILDPASEAECLRKARPAGGYPTEPSFTCPAPGVYPRAIARSVHHFSYLPDGTVLFEFDYKAEDCAAFDWYMAMMAQEKCDMGGGILRFIPGCLPFEMDGKTYDYRVPTPILAENALPRGFALGPTYWANKLEPPTREIDFLMKDETHCAAAFTTGFLPIDDGRPEIRRTTVSEAIYLVPSNKTYLAFAGGSGINPEEFETMPAPVKSMRGVMFRRYFPVDTVSREKGSVRFDIECGGQTYRFNDSWGE